MVCITDHSWRILCKYLGAKTEATVESIQYSPKTKGDNTKQP